MGSEVPEKVTFHVTGFKKFQGVSSNPTETIVSKLKSYFDKEGLPPGVSLGSCTVLETAGKDGLPMLYKVMELGSSSENSSGCERVVLLHLGVNGGASRFAIERQAVNEANFFCPDELGWQPQRLPVVQEDGGITRTRETTCSIDAILEFLTKTKGYDAMISNDAGRFVCNYVYYHSLRYAEQKGHKSLFLHVPLFSRVDEETQMQFVAALMEAIASTG